jgi:hypothetical protein
MDGGTWDGNLPAIGSREAIKRNYQTSRPGTSGDSGISDEDMAARLALLSPPQHPACGTEAR